MIIADGQYEGKENRTITEWVQEESAVVVQEILQRLSPAVRQAMTTLEAIETGTQTLTQSIGITEALMVLLALTDFVITLTNLRVIRYPADSGSM